MGRLVDLLGQLAGSLAIYGWNAISTGRRRRRRRRVRLGCQMMEVSVSIRRRGEERRENRDERELATVSASISRFEGSETWSGARMSKTWNLNVSLLTKTT